MKSLLTTSLLFVIAMGLFGIGCATEPMSYHESTTADYVGNNQYEINSIGNSGTPKEAVRQNFYRKAYEVCLSKNMGFKVITKNSGLNAQTLYNGSYCTYRHCYPDYYYRNIPFDSGVIECTGAVDPELKKQFELAQNVDQNGDKNGDQSELISEPRRNAVSIELLGRGWLYSLNYDHLIFDRLAIGIGASYWNTTSWWSNINYGATIIPIYGNYYFMTGLNRFFLTAGGDLVFVNPTLNSNNVFQSSGGAAVVGGGYEYRGSRGLLFRVAPYIIIGASTTLTIGFTIGGVF